MAEEEKKNIITVDGKEYDAASLSDNSKKIIQNIQFTDQELVRLRLTQAALQTARQAYVTTLKATLEGGETEEAPAADAVVN